MTCNSYHITVLLLSILMGNTGDVRLRLVIVARGPSCPLARVDSWTWHGFNSNRVLDPIAW